ncbi:MAG: zinc ribbon domain-containing protein [Thermoleophilia bacterium]|nr:zinc ribbon domain-containing protein [Thermoleophilia bacterium]
MNFLILQADAAEGASSFFDSPWWKFTTMMAKAMLVAMWLALAFWTYKDARRRITDPLMIGVSVATSLIFPYVGTLFYVILRPPEYLEDVLERDLEIRAREQELVGGANRCPACRTPVRDDFLVCPKCRRELKVACSSCDKPLEPSWKICPYCASEQGVGRKAKSAVAEEDELFA